MAGEERFRLILHPTCPTSKSLVTFLREEGLLDEFDFIVLDKPTPLPEGVFPWAVPMVLDAAGDPVAMDPLTPGELASLLKGEPVEIGDEVEFFKKSILYSAYASALMLAHHSIEPLLQESFLYPALRLKPRRRRYEEVVEVLSSRAEEIYESVKEVAARALSLAVVRFYYYSGVRGWEKIAGLSEEDVSSIILAMASVGRSHLPVKPVKPDMAGYIASFISRGARGLLRKIEREYRETLLDEDYQSLIKSLKG